MVKLAVLTVSMIPFLAGAAAAAECQVPKQMTTAQKLPCVQGAGFMIDQPVLTPEQLANGPDFDAANPAGSRFAYFTPADGVICYFRPHYAFKSVKGQSLKFQCWQMRPDGGFYGRKGDKIDIADVKVVVEKNSGGENRASLFPKDDAANEKEIKADRIKVKYLRPPHPGHDTRYNEVFTEVAATRLLWALGFPADHSYSAATAGCVGCTADPFSDNLKDNKASIQASPVQFKVVSISRDMPWDEINPQNDETWSWADVARFYASGPFTREQKVEYDAYRLALGLITYHNEIDIQNRLTCAAWKPDTENPKICLEPMTFVQDVGSTFGKPKSFFWQTNPRGKYSAWKTQTVFKKPEACELRYPLAGDKRVLKEAQDLLVKRLAGLGRDRVKAIFKAARFDMMDQEQLEELRKSGVPDVGEAALNQWTDSMMARIAEVGAAQNCKP